MKKLKQYRDPLKKILFTFLASFLVLSTITLPLVTEAPRPAKANVPVFNIADGPPEMMIGPGMLVGALGINAAADAGETLVSVRVNILIPPGSPFDPSTGLAPPSRLPIAGRE